MPQQIILPLMPRWQHKMLLGLKTATSRPNKYGHAGDTFRQFGANFVILSIEKHTLGYIADNLYKEEGCDSPDEFKEVWSKLHPRKGFIPTQLVWVHFFRKEVT